jgi:hypothetical protein
MANEKYFYHFKIPPKLPRFVFFASTFPVQLWGSGSAIIGILIVH